MIRHLEIHGTLAESLRERARIAAKVAYGAGKYAQNRLIFRRAIHRGFRALALLRAADRIDARTGIPSDGLHYAEGQLFNVKDGRPEPL